MENINLTGNDDHYTTYVILKYSPWLRLYKQRTHSFHLRSFLGPIQEFRCQSNCFLIEPQAKINCVKSLKQANSSNHNMTFKHILQIIYTDSKKQSKPLLLLLLLL